MRRKKAIFDIMNETELLDYKEKHYRNLSKTEIKHENQVFYEALRTKNVLNKIPNKEKRNRRIWKDKSNEYIIEYFHKNCKGYNKKKLTLIDPGLRYIIKSRDLESIIWPEIKEKEKVKEPKRVRRTKWKPFSNEEVLSFVRKRHPDIKYREELIIKDFGAYIELKKRKINYLPSKPKSTERNLQDLKDFELITVYNEEYKGLSRSQLAEIDKPLYTEVLNRKIINNIPKRRLNRNDFLCVSDDELINYTKDKYPSLNEKEVKKKNKIVFRELKKRELLRILWPKRKRREQRPWRTMADSDIIQYSKQNYPSINNLKDLRKVDSGLCNEIYKRNLHPVLYGNKKRILLPKEYALKEYNEKYKRYSRTQLFKANRLVYNSLRKNSLLKIMPTGKSILFSWRKKSNEEILEEYKKFGSFDRGELHKRNNPLYSIMYKRGLLKYVPNSKRRKNKNYSIEEGLDAFSMHIEKCGREGKKLAKLQSFFDKYDPETLGFMKDNGPLTKYVQRYHKEMRKLEGKVE